jgi:hypothetical protein
MSSASAKKGSIGAPGSAWSMIELAAATGSSKKTNNTTKRSSMYILLCECCCLRTQRATMGREKIRTREGCETLEELRNTG